MSTEHSCTGAHNEIMFRENGIVTLRFIRLCNGDYWGGSTQPIQNTGDVPHHWTVMLQWMLGKVAEFANARLTEPAAFYELAGHGWVAVISKRMEADRLAGALACTKEEVCRFFANSVEIVSEVSVP